MRSIHRGNRGMAFSTSAVLGLSLAIWAGWTAGNGDWRTDSQDLAQQGDPNYHPPELDEPENTRDAPDPETSGTPGVQDTIPMNTVPQYSREELGELVSGNNAFACDLYRHLREQETGNLFLSPYSISQALAMTQAGARGQTAQQMASTLHCTLSPDRLHPTQNGLDRLLASRSEGGSEWDTGERFRLTVANSLWLEQTYSLLPTYRQTLMEHYGIEAHPADFVSDAEAARQVINLWVSERTDQKIPELVPPDILNALTRLVLVNAIYFKAGWASPFQEEQTQDGTFHLQDSSETTVPMMSQREMMEYLQGDGYAALSLPYVGHQLAMVVVLPDEGRFAEIEASLDPQRLDTLVSHMTYRQVELYLPRFRMESRFSLSDTLSAMGMPLAFDPVRADFSGMAEIPSPEQNLYLSAVIHNAFLSVEESGTEAAAASAVTPTVRGAPMAPPVVFRVDRPFLLFIRDNPTGSILFWGRVLDPTN